MNYGYLLFCKDEDDERSDICVFDKELVSKAKTFFTEVSRYFWNYLDMLDIVLDCFLEEKTVSKTVEILRETYKNNEDFCKEERGDTNYRFYYSSVPLLLKAKMIENE